MTAHRILRLVTIPSGALALLIPATPSRAQGGLPSPAGRNEKAVLRYLGPVLEASGLSALLFYQGDCLESGNDSVPFPLIHVHPPSQGSIGLIAIRQIFQDANRATVTGNGSGIIRIEIGNAPKPILGVKIAHLTLSDLEQYDPWWAIYQIEKTREFKAATQRTNLKLSPYSPGLAEVFVPPGAPHLPSTMNGITVGQALELIARTFRGVIIYGACDQSVGQNLFWIDFASVIRPHDLPSR